MRISIDVRHLASGPVTGVGVVTYELIRALAATPQGDTLNLFYNGWKSAPAELMNMQEGDERVSFTTKRIPNRFFDLAASLGLLSGVSSHMEHSDVHLSPHMLPLPALRIPRVLILHDLSFVRYPEFFSPRRRIWHARINPRAQALAAAALIVPSHSTARDAMDLWNVEEKRLHVIPWGTPSLQSVADSAVTEGTTLLFLGTVESRKNPTAIIEALNILQQKMGRRAIKLILAGAPGWGSSEVFQRIKLLQYPEAVEVVGYIDEKKKAELLRRADIFVYPSFYEGSALPVLEAMASGVPVIASNRTALPEVVGSAAILIDPDRPHEIAKGIELLLEDRKLYDLYRERGIARAKEWHWGKTAGSVRKVLESVCA